MNRLHPELLAKLVIAFYGDDFTGSADVMEVLTKAGLPTVLFLDPPAPEQLARFPTLRALGIAGRSRTLARESMEFELRPAFERLRALGAPLIHYKVCSTFDSSPEVGSIGRAIEIGCDVFPGSPVPLVVGAPALGRYCVFGNLFARSGRDSEVFRLDRHPTMRAHPVTPMQESDLRRALAAQTPLPTGLVDAATIALPPPEAESKWLALVEAGAKIILFDVIREDDLTAIGRLIWSEAIDHEPVFAAGSSGLEYALTAYWRWKGWLPPAPSLRVGRVDQLVVVSGSCSPVTARQIAWALESGFVEVPLQVDRLLNYDSAGAECAAATGQAIAAVREGRSVIIHTSRGPDDPRIRAVAALLAARGVASADSGRETASILGGALGRILRTVMEETGIRRAATTGGDTSLYIARSLGVEALEMAAPCAPGSPLCRLRLPGSVLDAAEVVFKGGQVGTDDFFGRVLEAQGEALSAPTISNRR